jgi:hypothetical protein
MRRMLRHAKITQRSRKNIWGSRYLKMQWRMNTENNSQVLKTSMKKSSAAAAIVGADAFASEDAPDLQAGLESHALGQKYSQYLFTGLKDNMRAILPSMSTPSAYFRGAWQIPGASINMGW